MPAARIDRASYAVVIDASAILVAMVAQLPAFATYGVVAVMWFIPDRGIERVLGR